MNTDQIFYVGLKAFIEKDGEVLVLKNEAFGLDFPGGKMKKGETDTTEALQREVREETGIAIAVGRPFTTWMITLPPEHVNHGNVFLIGYSCRYLSGEVQLSDEHETYYWVNKDTFYKLKENSDYFRSLETYFRL